MSEEKFEDSLSGTENAFKAFLAKRCEETFADVVKTFVFETMALSRPITVPTAEGHESLSGVKDEEGHLYVVVLTSDKMDKGEFPTTVKMKCPDTMVNALTNKDVHGFALNPFNEGGVPIDKDVFIHAFETLHAFMNAAHEHHHEHGSECHCGCHDHENHHD